MLERIAKLKRAAQKELEHGKTAFTNKVKNNSYAYAQQFGGIEAIVVCELICSELEKIAGETEELLAESIEVYQKRTIKTLISTNPSNDIEVFRYNAMRYVLERLSDL